VLFTSGTTGAPKLVAHDFGGLTAAITQTPSLHEPHVWATFYDIRRYGGLQIFLRAVLGNASLVLSSAGEPLGAHLDRLEQHGVTHISGTPSHWRRVLMHSAAKSFTPKVIRLSGEVADQAVLDGLKAMFPAAKIGHAYASTEAGVAFEVNDGLEGLPASLIGAQIGDIEMKVMGGNLQIRSRRTALGYIGENDRALLQDDGFVDTGDVVERRGERYYFAGRKDGIINVGGNKVHPEEVEAVINRHPSVQMSLVRSQRNRITGGLVVADVVLKFDDPGAIAPERSVQQEILTFCSTQLPRHKVPALVRIVSSLDLTAGGKLERRNA
jgi:acyl-coenzyme A synthetase/AMP-(fatty) acid ligase